MKVDSSHIRDAEYNEDTRTMTVTFVGGEKYDYPGVTPDDYQAFMQASSKGSFLHKWIIPRYRAKRTRG